MAHSLQRESETLNEKDQYNEQVMLGLRTDQGVARSAIRRDIRPWIEAELLRETTGRIVATQRGLHILNRIIEDLMI
jgi:coproporphyrinogen III oxidase-like Fe-S oxidoreductase